jgi:hypothetical protein
MVVNTSLVIWAAIFSYKLGLRCSLPRWNRMDKRYNTMVLVLYFEFMEKSFFPLLKWLRLVTTAPPCHTHFAPLSLIYLQLSIAPLSLGMGSPTRSTRTKNGPARRAKTCCRAGPGLGIFGPIAMMGWAWAIKNDNLLKAWSDSPTKFCPTGRAWARKCGPIVGLGQA